MLVMEMETEKTANHFENLRERNRVTQQHTMFAKGLF